MERRAHLHYGYKAYTGKVLHNDQVDRYNALQDRINAFINEGRPVPEHLLNGSHHLFATFAGC